MTKDPETGVLTLVHSTGRAFPSKWTVALCGGGPDYSRGAVEALHFTSPVSGQFMWTYSWCCAVGGLLFRSSSPACAGTKKPDPKSKGPGMPNFIRTYSLHHTPYPRESGQLHEASRSSDFRIILLPRLPVLRQWQSAAFVPDYGGGSAADLHRLPC